MPFFRNSEINKSFIVFSCLSVFAVFCASYFGLTYALFVLAICVVFTAVHYIFTAKRYRVLKDLSNDIDKILHENKEFNLERYSEGEISILNDEIHKMVVRLNTQAEALKNDKIYLSSSIADISHQIRTPLTSMNLVIALLEEEDLTNERRQELIRELFGYVSKIEWLINSLLKISKLDAGTIEFKREEINLYSLVKKSVAPLEVLLDLKNQNFVIKGNKKETFFGDFNWTAEAIENIIKNCMEHTENRGTISIELTQTTIYSQIVISDNGNGIAKEDLPNIFKRFYKGKNSSVNSVGIGLALAKTIINSQGGIIKAENNIDKGARFTVRFYSTTV